MQQSGYRQSLSYVIIGEQRCEMQLDKEFSQSMDEPHGIVCHQRYGHQTCRRADLLAPVLDRPAPLSCFHDSCGRYSDLLNHVLMYRYCKEKIVKVSCCNSFILILIVVRTYPRWCVPATHDVGEAAACRGKVRSRVSCEPCGKAAALRPGHS